VPRRKNYLGFGVTLAAIFATGVFASVGLTSPPCQAKHGTCATATPTTTTATTTATPTPTTATTAMTTTSAATTTTATTAAASTTTTTTAATTTTTTAAASTIVSQLVTPEGATIQVYSDAVGGWTAQKIYDLLAPNAYQLSLIGPALTIKVSAQWSSSTTTSVNLVGGVYTGYKANTYLQANGTSAFSNQPDAIIAHEYGHAWSLYHLYITQQGDWTSYLQARGLAGNTNLDTSYMWNRKEILAEDYRLLFGTTSAQTEMTQMNYLIPDARQVAGLKAFLSDTWG
jgi:hypothetical protein